MTTKITRPQGLSIHAWNAQKAMAIQINSAFELKKPWDLSVYIGSKAFYRLIVLPNGKLKSAPNAKIKLAENQFIESWKNEILLNFISGRQNDEVYQEALFLAKYDDQFAVKMVSQLVNLGEYKKAFDIASESSQNFQKNAELQYFLAFINYHWDNDEIATAILNYTVTYLEPTYKVFELRSDLFRACGNFEEALINLTQAINMHPYEMGLYQKLGSLHEEKQEFAEAILVWNKVLEMDSDSAEAHYHLAKIYMQNKSQESMVWKHLYFAKELGHTKGKMLFEKIKQNPNKISELAVAA